MKSSLICVFLLAFGLCGCSFLGFHSDPYGLNDNEEVEESADEEDIAEVEEEEEAVDDDEYEEGEDIAEDSDKPGFFSRLFSFSDDSAEEGEGGDEEGGEGYRADEGASAEGDAAEGDIADMEVYDDEESGGETADMEAYDDEESGVNTASADEESYGEGENNQETDNKADYYSQSDSSTASPRLIPVKKIKTAPYRRAGFLVNAVYLARSGDTIQSVSQKIYGEDRTKALYSINPHFSSRPLKTGDKVYYPSSQRPDDSSRLLVYYEDIGRSPSYYSLKEGQNIRTAAKKLLGSAESWKELWAVNPDIQSKGAAEKDVDLKYWDGSELPAQAKAEPVPDEPKAIEEPPEEMVPPPMDESPPPIEEPLSESPPPEEDFSDPDPGAGDLPEESKVGIIGAIKKNKLIALGFIAFVALLLFSIKRIISRVRNPEEEFDYTKTSIDQEKISI